MDLGRQRVTTTVAEKEQSPSSQLCVRLPEAAGKRAEAKGGGADRSGSPLAAPPVHPHTSRRLGTPLLLINKSWRMRGAHIVLTAVRGAFSITHYYHIHIHFHWHASFPSAQIKPKRMQKGEGGKGRRGEGGREGEKWWGGWWWNAGPGHSSLHSNLHANGFVWEQGLYHEEWAGAEAEKQLQSADQGHDAASRHESPRCQQDPYTNPHRENKKIIISCIYELTWCKGYAHVDYFTVINDSVPIRGSISTGSWYCWSCTAELWWPDREEDGLD